MPWAKDDRQRELLRGVATSKKEGNQLLVELDGRALLRRIRTTSLGPGSWEKDKLVLMIILGPVLSEPQQKTWRDGGSDRATRRIPNSTWLTQTGSG